jgi:hypothetical protein
MAIIAGFDDTKNVPSESSSTVPCCFLVAYGPAARVRIPVGGATSGINLANCVLDTCAPLEMAHPLIGTLYSRLLDNRRLENPKTIFRFKTKTSFVRNKTSLKENHMGSGKGLISSSVYPVGNFIGGTLPFLR